MVLRELIVQLNEYLKDDKGEYEITYDDGYENVDSIIVNDDCKEINLTRKSGYYIGGIKMGGK